MKTKLIFIFFSLSLGCNSQIIEKFEIEPFFNPLLIQLGNLENNYVKEVNETYTSVSFNQKNSVELGIKMNYLLCGPFYVGAGMSWWKQKYDFLISINPVKNSSLDIYSYNRPRNLEINYQSLHLFAGYRFEFNSEIKLEYLINKISTTKHNVAESISSQDASVGSNRLRFTDREIIYTDVIRFVHSLGINYSVSIYDNLRIHLGVNWLIHNKNSYLYSYTNDEKDNFGSKKSTLLDLKIGGTQEYFFYTGFAYRFNYEKK